MYLVFERVNGKVGNQLVQRNARAFSVKIVIGNLNYAHNTFYNMQANSTKGEMEHVKLNCVTRLVCVCTSVFLVLTIQIYSLPPGKLTAKSSADRIF